MNIVILQDETVYNVYCMTTTECGGKIIARDLMIQLNDADELGSLLNKLSLVGLDNMQTNFEDIDDDGNVYQKVTQYGLVTIETVEVTEFDKTIIDVRFSVPDVVSKEDRVTELKSQVAELSQMLKESEQSEEEEE